MIKERIKFTDYNGVVHEEDFYFNLSKAEIVEMEANEKEGLVEKINKVIETNDRKEIVRIFKDIIAKSYGKKSEDGIRFIKNDEVKNEFLESEAYSELFTKLANDEQAAVRFVNGILPANIQ